MSHIAKTTTTFQMSFPTTIMLVTFLSITSVSAGTGNSIDHSISGWGHSEPSKSFFLSETTLSLLAVAPALYQTFQRSGWTMSSLFQPSSMVSVDVSETLHQVNTMTWRWSDSPATLTLCAQESFELQVQPSPTYSGRLITQTSNAHSRYCYDLQTFDSQGQVNLSLDLEEGQTLDWMHSTLTVDGKQQPLASMTPEPIQGQERMNATSGVWLNPQRLLPTHQDETPGWLVYLGNIAQYDQPTHPQKAILQCGGCFSKPRTDSGHTDSAASTTQQGDDDESNLPANNGENASNGASSGDGGGDDPNRKPTSQDQDREVDDVWIAWLFSWLSGASEEALLQLAEQLKAAYTNARGVEKMPACYFSTLCVASMVLVQNGRDISTLSPWAILLFFVRERQNRLERFISSLGDETHRFQEVTDGWCQQQSPPPESIHHLLEPVRFSRVFELGESDEHLHQHLVDLTPHPEPEPDSTPVDHHSAPVIPEAIDESDTSDDDTIMTGSIAADTILRRMKEGTFKTDSDKN